MTTYIVVHAGTRGVLTARVKTALGIECAIGLAKVRLRRWVDGKTNELGIDDDASIDEIDEHCQGWGYTHFVIFQDHKGAEWRIYFGGGYH